MTLQGILLLTLVASGESLLGFDCGGTSPNVSTFSLLDVDHCEIPNENPAVEQIYLQLLQKAEFEEVDVLQCKIEIDRIIYRCGAFSHNSIVHNGRQEFLHDITQVLCIQMHTTGTLQLHGATLANLQGNSTSTRGITLAGSIDSDGTCQGTRYSDYYGAWSEVIVQATVKITLQNYRATARVSRGEMILRSGTRCTLSRGSCFDVDGASTFWIHSKTSGCGFEKYEVLYEGEGSRIAPPRSQQKSTLDQVVYSVTTSDSTFALMATHREDLCGYTLTQTEHPKLVVHETTRGRTFTTKNVSTSNLDIFTYVNSKFVYVERHIRTQITNLYSDIIHQKCQLEQQIILNAMALVQIMPEEFALAVMKEPGYTSIAAGEVVHIVKCVPINTRFRKTDKCYLELPVTYNNKTYFLKPNTRILVTTATETECVQALPSIYRLEDSWYKITPQPVEVLPPQIFKPLTTPQWQYNDPGNLALQGIYTDADLDKIRDQIMMPAERPALLNTIARGAAGRPIDQGSISISGLMDENTFNKMVKSSINKMWSGFITFGTASAGLLGAYMVFKTAKVLIDSLIHGIALHSIYGWSFYLIGAIWDSLTNLLIHLGNRRRTNIERNNITEEDNNEDRNTERATTRKTAPTVKHVCEESNLYPCVCISCRAVRDSSESRTLGATFSSGGGGVTSSDSAPPGQ